VLVEEGPSLRILIDQWVEVVASAHATILSRISGEQCDAYLLSESSLFVYDRSIVMITCGTTSLVNAVERMFRFIPLDQITLLMYERKNEHFPEDQPSDFEEDVVRLKKYVPGEGQILGSEDDHYVGLFHYGPGFKPPLEDITLELLMHGLSEEAAALFRRSDLTREQLYRATGINRIFDDFQVDDFRFDPMGYSVNGIRGREYYTFHVTPEVPYSYASFETNHQFGEDLDATVNRVLDLFRPHQGALVLFTPNELTLKAPELPQYYHTEQVQKISVCGYQIRFRAYSRL